MISTSERAIVDLELLKVKAVKKSQVQNAETMMVEILRILSDPLRSKILMELKIADRPLAYSEIRNRCLVRTDGKLNNEGWIFYNIELLKKRGFIAKVKRRPIKSPTGKIRRSFYQLTKKGIAAANVAKDLMENVKNIIEDMSINMSFLLVFVTYKHFS